MLKIRTVGPDLSDPRLIKEDAYSGVEKVADPERVGPVVGEFALGSPPSVVKPSSLSSSRHPGGS